MKEILFLKPYFKRVLWGGNRMKDEYGYDIPGNDTGECWAISAHPHGEAIISNGIYAGMPLSVLFKEHKELFGNCEEEKFPLLVKIIDAKHDLSIQVHPDDQYARKHENGTGKTECWYILDCDENAEIVIGHNAKDKTELEKLINEKRWDDLISTKPIKKGDFFQIEPGTVHAIKGGTMILETQQSSDITYRLYDYDRLQNGVPRELNIEKSIDVISCPYVEYDNKYMKYVIGDAFIQTMIDCSSYTVKKIGVHGYAELIMDGLYQLFSVIDGMGKLDDTFIKKGDHFILPAGYKKFNVSGDVEMITSYVKKIDKNNKLY